VTRRIHGIQYDFQSLDFFHHYYSFKTPPSGPSLIIIARSTLLLFLCDLQQLYNFFSNNRPTSPHSLSTYTMVCINEPIAVIGSSCKFPGDSTSPSKLWELLKEPKDVSRKIDRFRADNWHNTDGHYHGASNVLDAYLLTEDPKAFDAQFFSISGGEADSMDPQQRVLLETVYEGIESAGLTIESLQETSTAVYVGVMCDDYNDVIYNDSESIPKYAATGSARSILSNRVSYFFNWTGPSMTIDTACSSSLVGVHQAVQVLRSRESRVAVAAGSNLIFGPSKSEDTSPQNEDKLTLFGRNVHR
jgi:acyl transferase domain-containing protein